MPFQPFGDKFDIRSPSSPYDVKQLIRARKKGWFHPKDGARGWIAGPVICLWLRPNDRFGPMLLGWISPDGPGTRIVGRAGSDLNGLLLLTLFLPIYAVIPVRMAMVEGDPGRAAMMGGFFALVIAVTLWAYHAFRKEAEPLVRFLRDTVARAKSAGAEVYPALTLDVCGYRHEGPVTRESIHEGLREIGLDGFVILQRSPTNYIQTTWRDGGFALEMRKGDALRHCLAVRLDDHSASRETISFDEVLAAFMAYASGKPTPPSLQWEAMLSMRQIQVAG
ncbi:hypothetical protein [Caulobacter sp. 17J65-9]|uniref:hypothetical protein n=1 Tax=Caulobacter sp. 17J65-9 TaxID=2709382 RepID=UPI0013C6BA74|nr:hypothetical protein [Caulobacter sp. 17J65-9]NEX92448.1 hypothetical protein [Caulobacter sp. 17J65-9]